MIEATQKKLREATFFLSHLEREGTQALLSPTEAVEFYLSAFLSAARSVTFVLEAEEPEKYPEWSRTWRASLTESDRQLLAKFTSARNRALKRETPTVAEDWLASAAQDAYAALSAESLFFFDGEFPAVANRVLIGRLTPDSTQDEVVPSCRQYADLLSRLVAAFLKAHE